LLNVKPWRKVPLVAGGIQEMDADIGIHGSGFLFLFFTGTSFKGMTKRLLRIRLVICRRMM
jgi:hypothetical protein